MCPQTRPHITHSDFSDISYDDCVVDFTVEITRLLTRAGYVTPSNLCEKIRPVFREVLCFPHAFIKFPEKRSMQGRVFHRARVPALPLESSGLSSSST